MRVPILLVALLSSAVAAPKPLQPYLTTQYVAPVQVNSIAVAQEALTPAVPTISPGDINGAIKDAQVKAADQTRAAIDSIIQSESKSKQIEDHAKEIEGHVKEIQGQAVDAAEVQAWKAVSAASAATARLDGAAAAAAPAIAKSLATQSTPIIEPYIPDESSSSSLASPTVYAPAPAPVEYTPVPFWLPSHQDYVPRYAPPPLAALAPTYVAHNPSYSAPAAFNIASSDIISSQSQNGLFYPNPVIGQELYSAAIEAVPQPYYIRGELLAHPF